jgi:quercetin dioxygenase-like cupin family protein
MDHSTFSLLLEDLRHVVAQALAPAIVFAAGSFAAPLAHASPEAGATPLMTKPLADYLGKEGLMLLVEYPPGSIDPVHRHDAHAFIYVLEGSIVM